MRVDSQKNQYRYNIMKLCGNGNLRVSLRVNNVHHPKTHLEIYNCSGDLNCSENKAGNIGNAQANGHIGQEKNGQVKNPLRLWQRPGLHQRKNHDGGKKYESDFHARRNLPTPQHRNKKDQGSDSEEHKQEPFKLSIIEIENIHY